MRAIPANLRSVSCRRPARAGGFAAVGVVFLAGGLSGCLAPAAPVASASASAGAYSAARGAPAGHALDSDRLLLQSSANPAFSVAPAPVASGVLAGAALGASSAELERSPAPPMYYPHPGYVQPLRPEATAPNLVFINPVEGLQPPADSGNPPVGRVVLDAAGTPAGSPYAELALSRTSSRYASPELATPFPVPAAIRREFVDADTFVDEPPCVWRTEMRRRFSPLLVGCKTRREAILKIARECSTVCGVKYSTARRRANQNVLESLETGTASCTGLSILLAAAYRSVGIPARLVQVASWSDRPGNHTWVEVWDEDGWHFTEYYPDAAGLDRGWILEPCSKLDPVNPASRVVARSGDSASEVYLLPWAPERTQLRGEDRTGHYWRLAASVGHKPAASRGVSAELIIIGAEVLEKRAALPYRVLRADGSVLASGLTPGPLDDANNAPRIPAATGERLRVEITRPDGTVRTLPLTVAPGPNEVR